VVVEGHDRIALILTVTTAVVIIGARGLLVHRVLVVIVLNKENLVLLTELGCCNILEFFQILE
jgi:NADH:ubiquinone oxidoreductase subunit K